MASESSVSQFQIRADQQRPLILLAVLFVLLLYFYAGVLRTISTVWSQPEYSHGWLIPIFAAVLLWLRRKPIAPPSNSAVISGLGMLAVGLAMWLFGTNIGLPYLQMIAFMPCLFAVILIIGGWDFLKWAGPALGFLVFMYPLPGIVARALLDPMQKLATICSTYALQTLGVPANRTGNVIHLAERSVGVVEACSGLRMMTIFLAMSFAVILITDRPWWERITIILSSVPIALLVNVIRITATGVLLQFGWGDLAEELIHDLAGYFMMPLAIGFLFLELMLLANLFIEDEDTMPMPMAGVAPVGLARVK